MINLQVVNSLAVKLLLQLLTSLNGFYLSSNQRAPVIIAWLLSIYTLSILIIEVVNFLAVKLLIKILLSLNGFYLSRNQRAPVIIP